MLNLGCIRVILISFLSACWKLSQSLERGCSELPFSLSFQFSSFAEMWTGLNEKRWNSRLGLVDWDLMPLLSSSVYWCDVNDPLVVTRRLCYLTFFRAYGYLPSERFHSGKLSVRRVGNSRRCVNVSFYRRDVTNLRSYAAVCPWEIETHLRTFNT